jgi:hypothetical protein
MATREVVTDCKGTNTLSTRINDEMDEFVNDEADRVGATRAEYIRRLLKLIRSSQRAELRCPECSHVIIFPLQA